MQVLLFFSVYNEQKTFIFSLFWKKKRCQTLIPKSFINVLFMYIITALTAMLASRYA